MQATACCYHQQQKKGLRGGAGRTRGEGWTIGERGLVGDQPVGLQRKPKAYFLYLPKVSSPTF
eukprot:874995-Rhodomonas_salina.1